MGRHRPGCSLSLEEVRDFFVGCCLAVVGLPVEAGAPAKLQRAESAGNRKAA